MEGVHPIPAGQVHPGGAPDGCAGTSCKPEMDKRPMKTINLKKYYYPLYETDTFVELPDEVADAIVEESRAPTHNSEQRLWNHLTRWTIPPAWNTTCPEHASYPRRTLCWREETAREQEAAHALMMQRLREALATLTPRQARRLHARFCGGQAVP